MSVQSVVFHKDKWTKEKAEKWLSKHSKFKNNGVDEKEDTWRFRQINPEEFKKFKSKKKKNGITFIYGYDKIGAALKKRPTKPEEIQSATF